MTVAVKRDRSAVTVLVAWLVLFAALVALEGLGLAKHGWPTVSDLVRDATRPLEGRWVLLGAWLWLGWAFVAQRAEDDHA